MFMTLISVFYIFFSVLYMFKYIPGYIFIRVGCGSQNMKATDFIGFFL